MRLSRRRTGTAVTNFAKPVSSLAGAVREFVDFAHVFSEAAGIRRQVEQYPVGESAPGSVGIISYQCQALRTGRRLVPGKLRRAVSAIAGELLGNVAAILEIAAGDRECHVSSCCRRQPAHSE